MPDAPTELLPVPEPSPQLLTAERKRAEIDALAAKDPDRTADLLREMLDERPVS